MIVCRCSLHQQFVFPQTTPSQPESRTFITCSSLRPCCTSSCTLRGSSTDLFSRKASLVRRFAYSRKLYAVNWLPCRNSWRYCATPDVSVLVLPNSSYSSSLASRSHVSLARLGHARISPSDRICHRRYSRSHALHVCCTVAKPRERENGSCSPVIELAVACRLLTSLPQT